MSLSDTIFFMANLFIIGIGGGNREGMTREAYQAISSSDIIAGYTSYVDLVSPLFPQKEIYSTGMMKESERCEHALRLAAGGKKVALVCSGDAGVYGMASLVYEIAATHAEFSSVEIEVIAGVTAALGGAALLGAPLSHDFCIISLSNLLTPQETIEKRLRAAVSGDFCIALYNPRSKNRPDTLKNACRILMENLSPDTPCGWARNISREGEESHICTLSQLAEADLDMFCTAFIGNSTTKILTINGSQKLVTPRGYQE